MTTRINTNVSSLVAQTHLLRSNDLLQESLTRLSTGLRINTGADDPAGLIASETLRRDITSVEKAVSNTERAVQLIATADSALDEVSGILNDIRGLVVEAANVGVLSDEQVAANQLQVDSSLDAINRISQVTTFQGRKLLDGSLDFIVDSGDANLTDLNIRQANFGTAAQIAVDITVTTAATRATLSVGAGAFGGAGNSIEDNLTIRITGSKGSEVFTFQAGATNTQIISAIDGVTDATGIDASTTGADLVLTSTDYGSGAVVEIEVIEEDTANGANFTATLGDTIDRNTGADVVATVNGVTANGDGNNLSTNTSTLALGASVAANFTGSITFNIIGGGATFQLGPNVVSNQQIGVGVTSVNIAELGGSSGRLYELRSGQDKALDTDVTGAQLIVDEAITEVAQLRGRLGAFERTTLGANIRSLNSTLVNLSDAESSIRDADFAKETAKLTKAQILVQAGTAVLGIANQNPQNVLGLLR